MIALAGHRNDLEPVMRKNPQRTRSANGSERSGSLPPACGFVVALEGGMTRGFAAIGLCQPKWVENVGGVFRAAHNFGASLVCIEGKRFEKQASDTPKTWRHTPFVRGDDLMALCPYGAVPVAVELCEGATDLFDFIHPERAFYIFGPEDSGVPKRILERVKHRVMVPTRQCMNLAATVTVVLYDRAAKGAHQ